MADASKIIPKKIERKVKTLEAMKEGGMASDKQLEELEKLKKLYPEKKVILQDEAFTSAEAKQIILQSGAKKKKRREKGLVDKISAVLILQEYMERNR